ncbi:MAG: hypothetical protein KDE56_07475 [Anaerolineales bacterium]|nr:hypothetical protein [Anaerolineales bacterium]
MKKSLLTHIGEAIDRYHAERGQNSPKSQAAFPTGEVRATSRRNFRRILRWFLPNGGTLILIALLIATQSVWARSNQQATSSTNTISYQGRLADSGGTPLNGFHNLEFRIYNVPSGGTSLWEELWTGGNSVGVSDGLFNVMLGSINTNLATAIEGHNELHLGITVDTDSEMMPRVQLGSVPFSMQALTVPNGSITTEKIADGAVTSAKLAGSQIQASQDHQLGQSNITGTTAYQDKASATITTNGEPLLIQTSFGYYHTGPVGSITVRVQIDGVETISTGDSIIEIGKMVLWSG